MCVLSKLVLLVSRFTNQAAAPAAGHSVMSEVRANQFLHPRPYLLTAKTHNPGLCPFMMSQRALTGHTPSQVLPQRSVTLLFFLLEVPTEHLL